MANVCNIDQADRRNRIIIGIVLLLASIFYFSRTLFIVISLVLIIEGIVGWCGISAVFNRFKR